MFAVATIFAKPALKKRNGGEQTCWWL